jgi:hypothetical protein
MSHYRFGENKTFVDDIPDKTFATEESPNVSPINDTVIGMEFQKRGLELKSILIGVLVGMALSYIFSNQSKS